MAATETIKKLRERVGELEGEVKKLKRELAGRFSAEVSIPVGGLRDGHGRLCQCVGCRSVR